MLFTPSLRKLTIQGIVLATGFTLLARLFFMQVLDPSYQEMSKDNVVRETLTYSSRGLIFDRERNLIVNNEAVYDLLFVPRQAKSMDTAKFCNLLGITPQILVELDEQVKDSRGYSPYKPQVLLKQLPASIYNRLQEYLYQFPGFYPQIRTIRQYNYPNAAHVLGYVGEVNQEQIDTSNYYRMGDYCGVSGIERSYEEVLRGERGAKYAIVDVLGREIGNYKNGALDREAVAGKNIMLTLDMELQAYAEDIMQNKRGSIVAIDPASGEILAFVSSPSYNPALLSGSMRGRGMLELAKDSIKQPLFNRALMAAYPPGSTFKPLMALLALQEKLITPNYFYPCDRSYKLGRRRVKCHYHQPCYHVKVAIEESCNAYFCHLFKIFVYNEKYGSLANGLRAWDRYLYEFGLGTNLHLDLPVEKTGRVPTPESYNKMYGRNKWGAGSIISLGIGQGELGMTPAQMAQMIVVIANRGWYYYPHVIRHDPHAKDDIYNKKQFVSIDPVHFNPVIEGLERVVTHGTAKKAYVPGLNICGKTGTAQNPHGDDHSMFIGFAPRYNPQIAIAVVVENAGKGGDYAAPIASLVIEKYVRDKVSRERLESRMRSKNLLHKTKRRHQQEWNASPDSLSPYQQPYLAYPSSDPLLQPTVGASDDEHSRPAIVAPLPNLGTPQIVVAPPTSVGQSGGEQPSAPSNNTPIPTSSPEATPPPTAPSNEEKKGDGDGGGQ